MNIDPLCGLSKRQLLYLLISYWMEYSVYTWATGNQLAGQACGMWQLHLHLTLLMQQNDQTHRIIHHDPEQVWFMIPKGFSSPKMDTAIKCRHVFPERWWLSFFSFTLAENLNAATYSSPVSQRRMINRPTLS